MNNSDFTTGSIPKKLVRFMFPILGALILQAAYAAVDLLIVGRFGTTAGISGVNTGSVIINIIVFTVASLSTAVTVLLGRYIGEKNPEKCSKVVGGALCFFLIISIVISVVALIFAPTFARWLQAPAEAMDLTIQYIRICGGGMIFIVFYNLLSALFRGIGDSRTPLIFVGIACVINIFGDLLLVAVFDMNVAGAAIATVAAQAVSVLLSVIIIRKKELPFKLSLKDFGINNEIKNILKIGFPMVVQEIVTQFSFVALCAFINKLGIEASSGYGIANKLVSFIMLIPSSLMQSMSAFVAQNVGAKREDRAKKAMVTGMIIGASIGVFVSIFVYFRGDLPSMLFSRDPAVIARSFEYLKGFATEAIVTSILFSYIGYFSAHGRTVWVLIQSTFQTLLIRLPLSYLMSIQPNASLTKIGLAMPAATIAGILINTIYYFYINKKTARKSD